MKRVVIEVDESIYSDNAEKLILNGKGIIMCRMDTGTYGSVFPTGGKFYIQWTAFYKSSNSYLSITHMIKDNQGYEFFYLP